MRGDDLAAADPVDDLAQVLGRRAAAAADQRQAVLPGELVERVGAFLGRQRVLGAVLAERRQAGVGPNAGLPIMVKHGAEFPITPEELADAIDRFVDEFGVNIVGGCCGTTPEHLKLLVDGSRVPRPRAGDAGPSRARIALRHGHSARTSS